MSPERSLGAPDLLADRLPVRKPHLRPNLSWVLTPDCEASRSSSPAVGYQSASRAPYYCAGTGTPTTADQRTRRGATRRANGNAPGPSPSIASTTRIARIFS